MWKLEGRRMDSCNDRLRLMGINHIQRKNRIYNHLYSHNTMSLHDSFDISCNTPNHLRWSLGSHIYSLGPSVSLLATFFRKTPKLIYRPYNHHNHSQNIINHFSRSRISFDNYSSTTANSKDIYAQITGK